MNHLADVTSLVTGLSNSGAPMALAVSTRCSQPSTRPVTSQGRSDVESSGRRVDEPLVVSGHWLGVREVRDECHLGQRTQRTDGGEHRHGHTRRH